MNEEEWMALWNESGNDQSGQETNRARGGQKRSKAGDSDEAAGEDGSQDVCESLFIIKL